jgi:hypothetical protein
MVIQYDDMVIWPWKMRISWDWSKKSQGVYAMEYVFRNIEWDDFDDEYK